MKGITYITIPVLVCAFSIEATFNANAQAIHDFRIVNGKTVDLGPVHEWLAKPVGERPMKHWKRLQVLSVAPVSGWFKCQVKNEADLEGQLLIANLPKMVVDYHGKLKQQYETMERLRAQIAAADAKVRRADAVTPTEAYGDRAYVDSVMAQRHQVNLANVQLQESKEQLSKLERDYREALEKGPGETKILAMFTGKKYSNLEIWDCGQQK